MIGRPKVGAEDERMRPPNQKMPNSHQKKSLAENGLMWRTSRTAAISGRVDFCQNDPHRE